MRISEKHLSLLHVAMDDPQNLVAYVRYLDERGNVTERTVSPIRQLTAARMMVYCLGREAVRTLKLSRVLSVRLRFACDVLPPEGVKRLVEHYHRSKRNVDRSTDT
jgi:predicted DNA-binding transcriptional regulator YafY